MGDRAVGALAQGGLRPSGDIYVAAVVQEEVGGLGTQKLVQSVHPDLAVVGEATSNHLARGHRGRIELVVRVRGRSVHASVPEQGVNPHQVLARFIQRLENLSLAEDEVFSNTVNSGIRFKTAGLIKVKQRPNNVLFPLIVSIQVPYGISLRVEYE